MRILAAVLALALTGCVSVGGTKPPSETYRWTNDHSTAMNVMRSIKLTKNLKDAELAENSYEASFDQSGAVKGTLTGLSSWWKTSGSMSFSGLSSLGLGVLSWLAHDAKGDMALPHYVVYLPITDVPVSESEFATVLDEAKRKVAKSSVASMQNSFRYVADTSVPISETYPTYDPLKKNALADARLINDKDRGAGVSFKVGTWHEGNSDVQWKDKSRSITYVAKAVSVIENLPFASGPHLAVHVQTYKSQFGGSHFYLPNPQYLQDMVYLFGWGLYDHRTNEKILDLNTPVVKSNQGPFLFVKRS